MVYVYMETEYLTAVHDTFLASFSAGDPDFSVCLGEGEDAVHRKIICKSFQHQYSKYLLDLDHL